MKTKKRVLLILTALLLAGIVILGAVFLPAYFRNRTYYGRGLLTLSFIDVGQGDSILIGTPSGDYLLVDAGSADALGTVEEELWLAGCDRLAAVVATHPHEDHIGGMSEILRAVKTAELCLPDFPLATPSYRELLKTAEEKKIGASVPESGDVIYDREDCRVTVLWNGDGAEEANDASIVLRITYGNSSALLMGDAGAAEETLLLGSGLPLRADLLKVGHHGSSGSTSVGFLAGVSPKISVISCGRNNDYGHPHRETLEKLASGGGELYRTDESGTLRFASDGKGWYLPR